MRPLEALARGLALELAPVRVNAVSPGLIETPLWNIYRRRSARQCSKALLHGFPLAESASRRTLPTQCCSC